MQAADGNTMSGVEVATMMRSIAPGSQSAASRARRAATSGEVAAGDVGRGEVAKADAGALDDPFVGGLDAVPRQARREVGVADPVGRKVAAGAGDAGVAIESGRHAD